MCQKGGKTSQELKLSKRKSEWRGEISQKKTEQVEINGGVWPKKSQNEPEGLWAGAGA